MQASQVRTYILKEHNRLRVLLEGLEGLARDVLQEDAAPSLALRGEANALLARLASHMSWEDQYLVPVLRQADAWGEARCERLASEHREQRELLEYALRRLHDEHQPDSVVAGNLLDLIELLREDMRDEEAVFLDERVLRDDVVAIDVTSG